MLRFSKSSIDAAGKELEERGGILNPCRWELLPMTVFTPSAAAMDRVFGLTVKRVTGNSGTRSAVILTRLSLIFTRP